MKTTSISLYIYLGFHIRYLLDCRTGYILKKKDGVFDNIKTVLYYLDDLNLNVTKRTRAKLYLDQIYKEFEKKDKDYVLKDDDTDKISDIIRDLIKTLDAETEGIYVYGVIEKRYSTNKLLTNISGLFSPKTFTNISEIAKLDFSESGKCIAFELPTASAFHSLRGTESVLRTLYLSVKKRDRIKNLTWGSIITDLMKIKTRRPPKTLLDNLDIIRNNYRNPTQHPELIYNIEQAQDLLSLCIGVVNNSIEFLDSNNIVIIH